VLLLPLHLLPLLLLLLHAQLLAVPDNMLPRFQPGPGSTTSPLKQGVADGC
jgi:hypothetical protein